MIIHMATHMEMPTFDFVPEGTPGAQMVSVLEKPYSIGIRWARIPEPGDYEVQVKIKWVGICGSDLEAYRGTRAPEFIRFPARLGHEVGGVISKVGRCVQGLREGDPVSCRYIWGAYAQYIVCKPFNVKVLPKHLPLDAISPIEVLPGILHAAELARADASKTVLIMGQGVSGLIMTQVMALFSPKELVVTDLYEKNLALARQYGATRTYKIPSPDTPTREILGKDFPDGFSVVIPCLLEGDGVIDAIDMSAVCGRIVLYGCIGVCHKPLDFFRVHKKRLEIVSTEPRRDIDMRRFYQEGVQMVCDGLINTSDIVTHRFPLSRIDEAFAVRNACGEDTIHVLIDCEH